MKALGKLSVLGRPTNLDNSRTRAYCACSRCGSGLFEHFFSRLSFLCPFSLCGRRPDIENTMLVSFDTQFIRQNQKQRRNGEACRASPTYFWSSLMNLISKDSYVVFYLSCIINRLNGEKTAEQMKSFVRTC